jgi:hypothetical protein
MLDPETVRLFQARPERLLERIDPKNRSYPAP